jgi:hypothetical protein
MAKTVLQPTLHPITTKRLTPHPTTKRPTPHPTTKRPTPHPTTKRPTPHPTQSPTGTTGSTGQVVKWHGLGAYPSSEVAQAPQPVSRAKFLVPGACWCACYPGALGIVAIVGMVSEVTTTAITSITAMATCK